MSPHLTITTEVADLLGSPAVLAKVAGTAQAGYQCTICGKPGRATRADPAAVIVLDHAAGPCVVRLAHGGCSAPAVRRVGGRPTVNPEVVWPAYGWLRPGDDPAAALLIGPRAYAVHVTPAGDTADGLTGRLLGYGFGLLTHPSDGMPPLAGLSARLAGDAVGAAGGVRLEVTVAGGDILWSGTLIPPAGWIDAARASRTVGVAVGAGLALDDPGRDQLAELHAAIGDGAVVGATAALTHATTGTVHSGRSCRPVGRRFPRSLTRRLPRAGHADRTSDPDKPNRPAHPA
jgi:hypothetical protein